MVWKKGKEIKNGIHLPHCPITLHNVKFPSPDETAEEFVALFAKNSRLERLPSEKEKKEKKRKKDEKRQRR